ncbi:DUF4253 domain-containing protein [Thermobispora bispora]|uniref:DUF4253 domain-containing protein n=2 Tax=Thermobispora bispora TaxID=2006 RepID=D6Y1M9_THEBD|nr:DUF4253 domain-containing protein [Thermobispora bispora]MBO2475734.1 DUF4253 domain-containing protein [Actinomycetales bacterium]MDI9581061.1 DUF4253 domain-containing protein [Thermobispora sp.]ADG88635.1 hypothetical protein Tbis_1923 [Thermobispora bispora DSM 43833]MBX6169279.1 DUF4253 domain-containing protein [Thermobispora bispora]QSI48421.1 DUF4253 domain-containing protein [Thermobispora bispora]
MSVHERRRLPPGLEQLFADGGAGRELTVDLPPGSLVWPDPKYDRMRTHHRPSFWLSDDPVPPGFWARLRREHPRSGLWPVLLEDGVQPWSAGQIAPDSVAQIDLFTAEGFMAEVWRDLIVSRDVVDLSPFGKECPGLAPPGRLMADPDTVADWYADIVVQRVTPLGLVAVDRSADAPVALGWQGAVHHNEWNVPLAAVLRSWEERFGVRVVGMGFDTLELSVAAPPMTLEHALHVAAEHWTFCPDSILQAGGSLAEYAAQIVGRNAWSFWWD